MCVCVCIYIYIYIYIYMKSCQHTGNFSDNWTSSWHSCKASKDFNTKHYLLVTAQSKQDHHWQSVLHTTVKYNWYRFTERGVLSVMVIIIGNVISNLSSNPGQIYSHFTSY